MLSIQPNEKLEVSFFEGVIHRMYQEGTGNVNPEVGFYLPIMGINGLLSDSSSGTNLVYGTNVSLKPISQVLIYNQIMFNSSSSWGVQTGVKIFKPFQLSNSYFLVEYNHVEPYSFTMDSVNILQSYTHNGHELAHPLGAGFDELVVKTYSEYQKWFMSIQCSFIKRKHELNSSLGADIFLANEMQTNQFITDKWMYGALEMGYLLNVKTRMQVYTGIYGRGERFSEKYLMIGFRTTLKNNYFDQ